MTRFSSFLENFISFLVLILLPLSTLAFNGVVPLLFILCLSTVLYWLIQNPKRHIKQFFKTLRLKHGLIVVSLFLLWSLFSTLWSLDPKQSFYLWGKLFFLFLAGIITMSITSSFSVLLKKRLLWSLALGLIITNLWLLLEIITHGKMLIFLRGEKFQLTTYNKAISLEIIFIWPIIASFYRFYSSSPDREVKYLSLLFQISLICQTIIVVFFLEATTVKIAFILGGLVALSALMSKKIVQWALLSVCTIFFIMAPLLYNKVFTPHIVTNITKEFVTKASFYHRLYIWDFVSKNIFTKPWMGWGLDTSRHKSFSQSLSIDEIKKQTPNLNVKKLELLPLHPHNLPLQLWLELGCIGVFLVLYLIVLILFSISRLLKIKYNRAAAYASFTTALIVNMGSYGIWQSWWISGLWLSIIFVRFLENKHE